jgi:DNA-binding MurR/RpiR family transcriptional regulator
MASNKNILERMVAEFPSLSPNARDIANYIQQDPLCLMSMSVQALADATNTSKATVSRFFRQLGYASHQEAKQAIINLRSSGFPLGNRQQANDDATHLDSETHNIQKTLQEISTADLDAIVLKLKQAKRIFSIGYRNNYPLALHLRQQLIQVRSQVVVLPQPGQTLGEDLVDVQDDDLVIVFGFRRRSANFDELMTQLATKQTILVCDPTGQVFNDQVTHLLLCHLGNNAAFDSYAAPMSLISLVCNGLYKSILSSGQARVSNISQLYGQLNELAKR